MTTFFVCSPPNGAVSRTEVAAAVAGAILRAFEDAFDVAGAVLRAFEDAFDVAGAVLRAFENASRTPEACFAHRISLPYRKSLFFTPNAAEDASRTVGSLFAHRMRIPYRRSLFLVRRAPKTHRTWLSGAQASCCRCGTSNFTKKESGAIPNSLPINFLMLYRPTFGGHIKVDLFL